MSLQTMDSYSAGLTGLLVAGGIFIIYNTSQRSALPLVNGKRGSELRPIHAQKRFLADARNILKSGLSKWSVFNILTESGYSIALSHEYANEIRSHKDLSFGHFIARIFPVNVPGFEPFANSTTGDEILQDAVRMKLTQRLGSVTKPLSDETSVVLQTVWTDDRDWHTVSMRTTILEIVAQLSSKVFLGDELCRNPDWLRITIDYTVDSFLASEDLRLWPGFMRPIVAPFYPAVRKVQAELQTAREIITPVLERRRAEKLADTAQGGAPKQYHDAMEWMEQCAKGRPYDAAVAQLSISLAAIHTTSDALTQVLIDICGQDGLVEALREEIITVLKEEGWQKTALYRLKLVDSTMKESQRLKPISIASMNRVATKATILSDGTVIPKGASLFVSSDRMRDSAVHANPDQFDAYRFLRMREESPEKATAANYVTPSPDHLAFGFGKHACPGRFFVSNEIKIALCHILLKYDFRLAQDCVPQLRETGVSLSADPMAKMDIKRREEEIVM